MTSQNSFRLMFYELIENYQFIEGWLEYLFAGLSEKPTYKGLEDVEKTNLSQLVSLVEKRTDANGVPIFTENEVGDLKKIVQRRNFWIHTALFMLPFDPRTGELIRPKDKKLMNEDLRISREYRTLLFEKQYKVNNNEN